MMALSTKIYIIANTRCSIWFLVAECLCLFHNYQPCTSIF